MLPYLHDIFATSLINYLRLIGFCYYFNNGEITEDMFDDNDPGVRKVKRKEISKKCSRYLNSISEIQSLKEYRNKVAGHFALTDPWDENLNTLFGSTNVSFLWDKNNKRFSMSQSSYISGDGGIEENKLPTFSLTQVFEEIKDRFYLDR